MNSEVQSYYSRETQRLLQRERLIETTRYLSVFALGGMIYFAFGFPETSSHLVLIYGSLVIFLFQIFEARTYQMARSSIERLRIVDVNIIAPAVDTTLIPVPGWEKDLSESIRNASAPIRFPAAFAATIFKAYFIIFITLDICWFSKLYLFPFPAGNWGEFVSRLDFGAVPGAFFLWFASGFWIVYTALAFWYFIRLRHDEASF
jgi:uncharacterized membrane protein